MYILMKLYHPFLRKIGHPFLQYQTTFKDLVTGKLPEENALLETLKAIAGRLKTIEWKIDLKK